MAGLIGSGFSSTKSLIGLGNIMPSGLTQLMTKGINSKNAGYFATKAVLDLFFTDWCIIMENPSLLATLADKDGSSAGVSVDTNNVGVNMMDWKGLPLIGFQFQPPTNYEILKYSYSEYPFLNRAVVTNSMMKEPTTITLQGLRPITVGNSVILNYILNIIGLKLYIEKYCDFGGLWTINTMWGARTGYVLTDLKGTMPAEKQAGVGWEFTFKRYNFDSQSTQASKNSAMVSL